MDSGFFIHFTKWTNILSISRNGQLGCPFHEMDNLLVHFTKWTISHLGRNIYMYNILSHTYDLITRIFDLITHIFNLLYHIFDLLHCALDLVLTFSMKIPFMSNKPFEFASYSLYSMLYQLVYTRH